MESRAHSRNPTHASSHLAAWLGKNSKPVLTQFEFFRAIWQMYREASGKRLYLRSRTPDRSDYVRLKSKLHNAEVIGSDRDYRTRVIRVLSIPDLPAEDIACLVDPTCYVSHLSAMQRWGSPIAARRPWF